MGALDLDRASRLHGDAFRPLGERRWTRQEIAGLLATPGTKGILLTASAVEVGMAIVRVVLDEAELLTIAVDPAWQGTGAGRCLLGAVTVQAREAGAGKLYLEVGADNPAARALYDSADFEIVGRRPGYYARPDGSAADAVIMRLTLK